MFEDSGSVSPVQTSGCGSVRPINSIKPAIRFSSKNNHFSNFDERRLGRRETALDNMLATSAAVNGRINFMPALLMKFFAEQVASRMVCAPASSHEYKTRPFTAPSTSAFFLLFAYTPGIILFLPLGVAVIAAPLLHSDPELIWSFFSSVRLHLLVSTGRYRFDS